MSRSAQLARLRAAALHTALGARFPDAEISPDETARRLRDGSRMEAVYLDMANEARRKQARRGSRGSSVLTPVSRADLPRYVRYAELCAMTLIPGLAFSTLALALADRSLGLTVMALAWLWLVVVGAVEVRGGRPIGWFLSIIGLTPTLPALVFGASSIGLERQSAAVLGVWVSLLVVAPLLVLLSSAASYFCGDAEDL